MRRIGTTRALTDGERARLLTELRYWQSRAGEFYTRREREEKAFLQEWKGQTPNGLRMDTPQEEAWPFNGSSDQRVRWGDTSFQEFLALVMVALDACRVEIVTDGTAAGEKRGVAIRRIVEWARRKLGAKWYEQVQALLRYALVDTPAVAAMDVGWAVKKTLGVKKLDFDTLQAAYTAWATQSGEVSEAEAAAAFAEGLGAGDETIAAYLADVQGVAAEHVPAVMAALAEDGACEVLAGVDEWEGPEIQALRFGDDFIIPAATEDFDRADPLIRQQWLGVSALQELAAEEGWDAAWVAETLKHKGASLYESLETNSEDFKDMVNLVWFYTTEVDRAGQTTRWVTVLSPADGSAFGQRVVASRRGTWQTVFFRREVLANNCLASRGLARLCAPDQGIAKTLKDGANNNAIIGSLPAIKAKGARVRNVMYEPFAVINMSQSDDVTFMQPPAYPAAAKEQVESLKRDMLAFLGLPDGERDVSARTRSFTSWMLSQFEELYKRLVEVVQDYASDAALAGVTGEGDLEGVRREDLDGTWQIALKFDPANMDHDDLIKRVTAFAQVIAPLDAKNEIDRAPAVRHVFAQLFPDVAAAAFRSADALAAEDVEDEKKNFTLIKAGVMPRMDTEGKWNYSARLEWHRQMAEENPDAIGEMSPAAQDIYQRWLQALQMQETQFGENAQIGRTGVEGV